MFAPLNYGVNEKEARKNAIELVKLVGLSEDYLEKSPFELSGGEQQMLAMGRALMSTPKLLLLDEPSIGLHQRDNDRLISSLKKMRDLSMQKRISMFKLAEIIIMTGGLE